MLFDMCWCKIVRSWEKTHKLQYRCVKSIFSLCGCPEVNNAVFVCTCALVEHVCGCACVRACVPACMHARALCVCGCAINNLPIILNMTAFLQFTSLYVTAFVVQKLSLLTWLILDSFCDWQYYASTGHQAVRSIWVHDFDRTCHPYQTLRKEGHHIWQRRFYRCWECIRHTWLSIGSAKETPWKREVFVCWWSACYYLTCRWCCAPVGTMDAACTRR